MIYTDKWIKTLITAFKDQTPGWLTTSEHPTFRRMCDLYANLQKSDVCLLINFHKHQSGYIKNRVKSIISIAVCKTEKEKQQIIYTYNNDNELFDMVFTENEFYKWIKTMKFDKIIMNPPYFKNLHLKILEKALSKLTDDGICVNLSPIKEFQKALLLGKEKPIKDIKVLDYISDKEASELFHIGMNHDVGIMSNKGKDCDFVKNLDLDRKIFKKCQEIINEYGLLKKKLDKEMKSDFIIKFGEGTGNHSGSKKCWFTVANSNKDTAFKQTESGHTKYYNAKTKKEQENVHSFYTKTLIRFICKEFGFGSQPYYMLPWMGDAVNPRTGKKGYESEWRDEDFYKYFGITENEQKLIETTMENYK